MTEAPERIWAFMDQNGGTPLSGDCFDDPVMDGGVEYVRADLPAAVTVKQIDEVLRNYKQLDELLCCSGFDLSGQVGCGCQGVTLREEIAARIADLFTTQPDPVRDAAREKSLAECLSDLCLMARRSRDLINTKVSDLDVITFTATKGQLKAALRALAEQEQSE